MGKRVLTVFAVYLALSLAASSLTAGSAAGLSEAKAEAALRGTAEYVYRTTGDPRIDPVGGDWAVFGLARSGYKAPRSYYENYYKNVESIVRTKKGVLDERKYSEYSRVILGLTAAGYDPRDVGGYDLTLPLGDFEKTVWQGLNGPIYALIALDGAGYDVPLNPEAAVQATREKYIAEILGRQLADGGFALSPTVTSAEPDITAMALQALSRYQDRADVRTAVNRALRCLSIMRGGFTVWGSESAESVAQAIVALCELGIGLEDPRFVKDGATLADKLMEFSIEGKGFAKTLGGEINQMSTEQALSALAAIRRFDAGMASLYDLTDTGFVPPPAPAAQGAGLPGKHAEVRVAPISAQGKTFSDIKGHKDQAAVEALAARGIIGGKSAALFDPDATMTRAEFASVIVRGLGLTKSAAIAFGDVRPADWFYDSVRIAYRYDLVSGVSAAAFNPAGVVSKEEAAAMVARAAALCGMNTALDDGAIQDMLAQFGDYRTVSAWARGALAFCYKENILNQDEFEIQPKEAVRRGEIAAMLYRMLDQARLL